VSTTPKTTTKKNIPSPQRASFLEKSEHSSLKESSKELMPTTSKTTTKANSPSSLQPIIKEKLNFMDNLNLLDNKTNSSPKVNQNANSFQEKVSSYKTMENVKTQIHDTIKYLSQDNKKQVILKLMPESLGKLDINISQIKQNTKVEIKVQNQETLQLLNDNQTSLKDLFSAIKKAGNDVSFSFDNNTNQQSSKESNSQNKEKQNKKYRTEKNILHYSDNETMTNYVGLIEIVV